MKGIRYTAKFKTKALKQITERGHGVVEVSKRLGASDISLYKRLREADLQNQPQISKDVAALKQEVNRLNVALKRATEERDILKKAAVYFASHQE
jgi:transposase